MDLYVFFIAIPILWVCWRLFLGRWFHRAKLVRVFKARLASCEIPEEAYYEMAAAEVGSGTIRKGLWAKALADALGDENKAGAIYIKLRVQSMRDEAMHAILHARQDRSNLDFRNAHNADAFAHKVVVSCPQCSKRVRVDAGKLLDITCAHCGHIFRAQT